MSIKEFLMKVFRLVPLSLALLILPVFPAGAHFGMIIPSAPTVMTAADSSLTLDLKFWHPFANQGMNLEKPAAFTVFHDGAASDLLPSLREVTFRGMRTWKADYKIARPGLYAFFMEPVPYFEPEEDSYIVHYTKVYVDAYGDDEGWDAPLGVRAEIVPLTKPGSLYAGNIFRGKVMLDGRIVPGAEVEVEWYPGPARQGAAPHDAMITQTVRADADGVFLYAAPAGGWWGFAALMEAGEGMEYKGEEKAVEIGAVLWVYFHTMQPAVDAR
jgi:cobalt/nickel transport protein